VLLLIFITAALSSAFFYCQAITSGLGRKRWAAGGFIFGPLLWPMFCAKRRMRVNTLFGLDGLLFKA